MHLFHIIASFVTLSLNFKRKKICDYRQKINSYIKYNGNEISNILLSSISNCKFQEKLNELQVQIIYIIIYKLKY